MASVNPALNGVAYIIYIGLRSQADSTIFQSNPTLASGDAKVSIDGGALANLSTLPAVTPASSKMVKVSLSAAEMTGDNITVVMSDASGAEWMDQIINIQTTTSLGPIGQLGIVDQGTAIVTNTDATHIQLRAALNVPTSTLVGATIHITGGTGIGQSRIITAFANTNDIATVDTWTTTPDGTSTYVIFASAPGSSVAPAPANVLQINSVAAATPGAAGGVLIAGNNAATAFTAGITVTQSSSNTAAVAITGNGTGNGVTITSGNGATGSGLALVAASTNGSALSLTGNGSGHGLSATPGATGNGIKSIGGATSGAAMALSGTAGNAAALSLAGQGSAAGLLSTGGATGHGISAVGGATSGDGVSAAASTSGHGLTATGVGTTKHGINATGGSTASHGIAATGGGVGHGINATSGGGATGDGIRGTAASTNGNGLNLVGVGTGDGLLATGGASAGGDGVSAVAGGGVGLRSDALTQALTESYAADGAAATTAQLLYMIQQVLTEFGTSGTTITINKLDGTTPAATLTVDDATAPTSITRAS